MVDSLNRLNSKIIFVTDPMCSWCWGMADSIKETHEKYKDKIELDLMLGGTNAASTDFVGEYGKKFLFRCVSWYIKFVLYPSCHAHVIRVIMCND